MAFDYAAYNAQYKKDHYYKITIRIKKEQKEKVAKIAAEKGLTISGLFSKLLQDAIETEQKKEEKQATQF